MASENSKFNEVRKIILSLLLARKNGMSVAELEEEYRKMEGERIPFRKFGFDDLMMFLKSMPQHVVVSWQNDGYYVRGIASEKSKHVSSLVARQKSDTKPRYSRYSRHRTVTHYIPPMQRPSVKIPAEQLHCLLKYIQNYPDGLNLYSILIILQKQLPRVVLSMYDLRKQLRELSHQVILDGEMVYPVYSSNAPATREAASYQTSSTPVPQAAACYDQAEAICVAGDENFSREGYDSDDNDYIPAGCESSNLPTRQLTSERFATSFAQNANRKQMMAFEDYSYDNKKTDEFLLANCNDLSVASNKDEVPDVECRDISTLISDRTKARLDQLIRKHPEGIYCAELPDKYLNEYKIHLNYTELGFNSVREYVSYLPNIFYMTRVKTTDDFKLFSADKRPTIPDQETTNQTTESVATKTSFGKQYDEHNPMRTQYDNDVAIPTDISPDITSKFLPDDVMNYNDMINVIPVSDLQCKEHIEVYVVEVFIPSFFWIHLRENRKPFHLFMDNLQSFYENNSNSYTIPKVALRKDLNCACVFSRRWHRAIIKSVKADFRVTVLFYDYGTLKTYQPEEVYYLHKQFSYLPAQAIPCSLYNVKPYIGDRWKKSVTEQFIDKISDNLLVASIISVDPVYNSMMVLLTDTSEEEHVNVNDWLVNQNLARQGKLSDAVDMANLLKYVLNNMGQLPMYCYAEENLVANYCSKTTLTEQTHEIPLVSPAQTLLCSTTKSSNQQQQSSRPPPGFAPLNSSNIYSLGNTVPFIDEKTTKNPFLDDELSDTIPTNIAKRTFAEVWKENTELQIKLSRILYNLLEEHSSIKTSVFEDYMTKQHQINGILKDMEEKLMLISNNEIAVDVSTSNIVNEMTSHDINRTSTTSGHLHSNDKFASGASGASNPSNIFGSDKSTNQTMLPVHYDLNDFTFKTNWSQSTGEFNNSHVQLSPQLVMNPIFNNYTAVSNPPFQKTDLENKSMCSMESMMPTMPIKHIESSDSSSSSGFLSIKTEMCNSNIKETNPFKLSMIGEIQIPKAQDEQRINNYSSSSPYYNTINMQNQTVVPSNVEPPTSIYPKTDSFLPAMYANDISNAPKIVYTAKPVMYNTQKKEVNDNAKQDAFCSNDNAPSFMLEQYNKELSSQLASDMAALSLKYRDSAHVDEGYITRSSPTADLQNSLLMMKKKNEVTYHQKDVKVKNSQSVIAKPWKKLEIPERWINPNYEKNLLSSIYNNNTDTVNTTLIIFPQTRDNTSELKSQDANNTNDSNFYAFQDNDDDKLMDRYNCIGKSIHEESKVSTQENLSKRAACDFIFKNCFVFHEIDTIKGITLIFHVEENGWILTHEFVRTFTSYKLCSSLMSLIGTMNIKALLKEINRTEYPAEFVQLDRYPIDVPRDGEDRITSINLMSLQTALVLLRKLKIVSREEMDNAFKKNEFQEDSVLPKMWSLILSYRQLRQHIDEYIKKNLS